MKINGFVDGLPGDQNKYGETIWYIYKLTYTDTGHFYIGQTHKLKDRTYQHMTAIVNVIRNIPAAGASTFHKTVAPLLASVIEKEKRKKPESLIYKNFNLYIFGVVSDKQSAELLENYHIERSLADELCLNERVKNQ